MRTRRRRRGGLGWSEDDDENDEHYLKKGQVLEKDCKSKITTCKSDGCKNDKVVLDTYNYEDKAWIGHEFGKGENDTTRTIPIYDHEIACWKPVIIGGKRRRRRKTSKKGGSKRRKTRRRR